MSSWGVEPGGIACARAGGEWIGREVNSRSNWDVSKDPTTVGCQGGAAPTCANHKCGKGCDKVCKTGGAGGPPDMRLGGGVLSYYGDDVLAYDTLEEKWSRVGKMPYGLITSHCGTNGTHLICIGGEPRHAHNSNTETAVQIAEVTYAAAA